MTATITTAELAAELDTTARELRKFLRSQDLGVGKGKRYSLPATKRDIATMRKQYTTWAAAQDEARKARREALEAADAEVTPEVEVEVETDADDPTDEALAAIELEG